MWTAIVYGIIAALIAGAIVHLIFEKRTDDASKKSSLRELVVGAVVIVCIIAPATGGVAWLFIKNDLLTFHESLNGWESAAHVEKITCSRVGPCWHEYDCDPYLVPEEYECGTMEKPQTCTHMVTKYHSCPYVTHEYSYFVYTTVGNQTIDTHRFPNNPDQHRYREYKSVPDSVAQRAGVGEPASWARVRDRLLVGKPEPVTARKSYTNYLLASDTHIFQAHSADIDTYRKLGLLPNLVSAGTGLHVATPHVFGVGEVQNLAEWTQALRYANAVMAQRTADVYVVLVNDARIHRAPDEYAEAFRAHWFDTLSFERDALAKNAVVFILATEDNKTIAWARAFTGMPVGNEWLPIAVRDRMAGMELDPVRLLGGPTSTAKDFRSFTTVSVQGQKQERSGYIEDLLFGRVVPGKAFVRTRMNGVDGNAGFQYLENSLKPTDRQLWGTFAIMFVLSFMLWVALVVYDDRYFEMQIGRFFKNIFRRYP